MVKSRRMSGLWRIVAVVGIACAVMIAYMAIRDSVNFIADPAAVHSLPIGLSFFS